MRVPSRSMEDPSGSFRDAESLFRSKLISEIRNVESSTKKEIEEKKEELRQLVGNRYRDLIDSADSVILMKSSCESISSNISMIDQGIRLLSASSTTSETPKLTPNPARAKVYGIATRVKYLVDTPENIWGCLDESMFLEASGRYLRAKVVHGLILSSNSNDKEFLSNFPLLQHQWQIVESFKGQISQRSRERLMDQGLSIGAYADALAAVAVMDDLDPNQVLGLFLDSRKSWISQKLGTCRSVDCDTGAVISVFCDAMSIIQVTLGQVGELFLQVLNDMPLFYKNILGSPPGSQLFGGLPNPEEEVKLWKSHREKLESVMVMLDRDYIAQICLNWLKKCGEEIVNKISGRYLVDIIESGQELALAEKSIRESIDNRTVLEGSLEWLKSVFGSEIESPWNRICELVLNKNEDLWDGIFEEAFVRRMKDVIKLGFEDLNRVVNVRDSVQKVVVGPSELIGFQAYLNRPSMGGGVWFSEANIRKSPIVLGFKVASDESDFHACLSAYFGPEVSRIREAVDSKCHVVLKDLLCFLDSQKAALRMRDLAPYLQEKCCESVSNILRELENELEHLSVSLGKSKEQNTPELPVTVVERSLFVGRILFALGNHSSHIPLILGSPRLWVNESMAVVFEQLPSMLGNPRMALDSPLHSSSGRHSLDSTRQSRSTPRRQSSSASTALFGVSDSPSPKLEQLSRLSRELCIRAHSLWILWVSDELSAILSKDLIHDDSLTATSPLKGWEETVIRQQQPDEDSLEMKIALPSMPSLYIISFLFQACEEIHRIGGHVLDKLILQKFASRLLELNSYHSVLTLMERNEGIFNCKRKIDISFVEILRLGLTWGFLKEAEYHDGIFSCLMCSQAKLVLGIYGDFLSSLDERTSQVTEKGILQVLLDLRFTVDILSGGDVNMIEESSKNPKTKLGFKHNQDENQLNSANVKVVTGLINGLSQRLDPIDWATYEPYLWENEKQAYLRYAVLFGFFVQLNRMHTNVVNKLPSNSESNIMRCSTVPRFKYLPISVPALSSKATAKSALSTTADDVSSRSSWKAYSNGELSQNLEFDEASSFGVAAPLLKSFMQVGTRFGEGTFKLSSMLTDGQVGRLKDKSAAAMSTFGDMLPMQAAGLLSSLTAARSDI